MNNKTQITSDRKKLIIYLFLIVATFAVYWQVNEYDFITFDDQAYVTENLNIQSGITLKSIGWSFTTKYFGLWNPLVWLSFMADHELFGLKAGGYHLTNLIFHILSALLLFWLFQRMTKEIWKSAFVAALFALHPLHVESVAWIAERKDVLSGFFWMLTLCFYVYYTERPVFRRYALVLFSFIMALMSKPMVVTLPVVMILLDYWPLKRFALKRGNVLLWQLKEKIPLFILSAAISFITLYAPQSSSAGYYPLSSRIANAIVSFVKYLEKTFWPYDLAVFYPFSIQIPAWHVMGAAVLIIIITTVVILIMKRLPCLFVGWFWFVITIAPVIGIIQISVSTPYAMADRYHYLPSIGLAVILAWGIPALMNNEKIKIRILFPVAVALLIITAAVSWRQCSYWENSTSLFSHALKVTNDNYMAHNNLGIALYAEGKMMEAISHYDAAIGMKPDDAEPYYNRGTIYANQNNYQPALDDFNSAIKIRPDYADAYNNRGNLYNKRGKYQLAINDYDQAINLKSRDGEIYYNRAIAFHNMGKYELAVENYTTAIIYDPFDSECYNNRGASYVKLGRYKKAVDDLNKAVSLNPDYADAFMNLAFVYLNYGNKESGCLNARKACELGKCDTWKVVQTRRLCK